MAAKKYFQALEATLFRHRAAILWAGYFIAAFALLLRFSTTFAPGGRPTFAYGDMLINYAGGLTRRGLMGEAAVALSQWAGGPPWFWAWALIAAAAGLFFILAMRLVRRLSSDPKILPLVLALWSLMFFSYNYRSSFRKEVFGYLALVLVLQSLIAGSRGAARAWAAAGTASFLVGMFAYEPIIFLLPALMIAFILAARRMPEDRIWFASCATASAVLGIAVLGVLAMQPPPDAALICEAAQISCSSIPNQPFAWLGRNLGDAVAYVIDRRDWIDLPVYAVVAMLAALPLLGLRAMGVGRNWHRTAMIVHAVCMIPMFVIAIDWGRWIQMIVLPLSLIGIASLIAGLAEYRRVLPHWASVAYMAIWFVSHIHIGYTPIALCMLSALGMAIAASWIWERSSARGKARSNL